MIAFAPLFWSLQHKNKKIHESMLRLCERRRMFGDSLTDQQRCGQDGRHFRDRHPNAWHQRTGAVQSRDAHRNESNQRDVGEFCIGWHGAFAAGHPGEQLRIGSFVVSIDVYL